MRVSFHDTSLNTPTGWAWYFGDEGYNAHWTEMNTSPGWTARYHHNSVALPDGSIVLMGGKDSSSRKNDIWRSVDKGATWNRLANAEWTARSEFSSVVLPDGSIVLMGGWDADGYPNYDVWRSTDKGDTWKQQTTTPGWGTRYRHTSVALPDGSIVLMGGADDNGDRKNDVWRSVDKGVSWKQQTAAAEWSPRYYHSSVVLPDGSIILMGGSTISGATNDIWRSTDKGVTWTNLPDPEWNKRYGHSSNVMPDGSIVVMGGRYSYVIQIYDNDEVWRSTDNCLTWTRVNVQPGWSERSYFSSVVLPDGSIVLMGGLTDSGSEKRNVWRLQPAGSTIKDPVHTYYSPGNYTVSLQVYNNAGYNITQIVKYITVRNGIPIPGYTDPPTDPDSDGIYEDLNANGRLDFADVVLYFNQMTWIAANEPVCAFDLNANGRIDFADIVALFNEI